MELKLQEVDNTLKGINKKSEDLSKEFKSVKETFVSKKDLVSTKENLVSKEELKSVKDESESLKNEILEIKEALELEKKASAALFAKAESKKENAREKIIADYKKDFKTFLGALAIKKREKELAKK